jgi:peptide methionine sulfoxide reductase msrA/msrB
MMKKLFLFIGVSMALMAKTQSIVFGAGCFWGVEKYFDTLDGVIRATSGYAGGNYENPTYQQVLEQRETDAGIINHTEAVEVVYDDSKISTKTLIQLFWQLHDPTQLNRQGNDVGNNYRSALYYTNDEQKEIALSTKKVYQDLLYKAGYKEITTEIKPLEKFYTAEEYHQNYLKKNPHGYCPNHSTGVKFTDDEEAFYKALAEVRFGVDSDVFDVAYNKSTDRRFSKRYEEFKNTKDGVFVDKISGEILFDTRDRFDSGSGWLSFFKAVDGATIEKEDNSHGMSRTEVIAKKSKAHLGHVFDDAPNGRKRFCINATVLEFVPREELKR